MEFSNFNNLLELFYHKYKIQKPNEVFLTSLQNRNNVYSWHETFECIQKVAEEIESRIQEKDRCLLISENRPEWLISDLAIMLSKGITVPAYTTYTEKDYEYLINDCKPSVIIISKQHLYDKVSSIIKKNEFIKLVISFEKLESGDENLLLINKIFKKKTYLKKDFKNSNLKRNDLACIIYTSGTQGNPKGVMLSHGGILNNCEGSYNLLKKSIPAKSKFLTWLPLSHSYEHTVQFVQITVGAKIFYAESIDKLIKNMQECNPDIMTAVPRFYQNLYQKIFSNFSKTKGFKKFLVNKTLELGIKKLQKKKMTFFENAFSKICDLTVRKKIKAQFGGSLKAFVSGGGALDFEVGQFLNAVGLPTLQGYGLTETSPVVSCNPIDDIRIETVGLPFPGNKVKISEDGEILIKGENIMLGYWNNQEETDKVLRNGWLYSGDIGHFENGYLKITDRKKNIIITPGGENISPTKIENLISKINFVDQVLVYGDNKPYLVALIVLSENSKEIESKIIFKEIENINNNLTKIEKIKKFLVIKEQFTIENGMMTPTLKLKRFKIIRKYKDEINKLY